MLDADRQHQRTAPTVLCYLASTVAITLHEGHQSRRCQRRIIHRLTFRADMAQVVTHTAATLHQLHLLLINAHHRTIRVGIAVQSYHETIRERRYLVVVADARHRTTGRHDVAEVVQQVENLLCRHRVLILLFDSGYLVGNAPVHLFGRLLIDIAKRILHSIFVHPHPGGQFVTAKISK